MLHALKVVIYQIFSTSTRANKDVFLNLILTFLGKGTEFMISLSTSTWEAELNFVGECTPWVMILEHWDSTQILIYMKSNYILIMQRRMLFPPNEQSRTVNCWKHVISECSRIFLVDSSGKRTKLRVSTWLPGEADLFFKWIGTRQRELTPNVNRKK